MGAATGTRRVDAVRNDERIDAGALAELGRDPAADMEAIAAACGVSRATLFRRYPSREALLGALRERAHSHLADAVKAADLDRGSATEALDRLIDALVDASIPYSFLLQNPASNSRRPGRFVAHRIEGLIRRGQEDGEFLDGAPPRWWADVIVAILQTGARGRHSKRRVTALIRTTLTDGLSAVEATEAGTPR